MAIALGQSDAWAQQEQPADTKTVSAPTTDAPTIDAPTADAPTADAPAPSTTTSAVPFKKSAYVASDELSRPGFSGHIADFVQDQARIWTSPSRIRLSDATWLVPLGGITAGLFVTDQQYSASISQNPSTMKHYKTVSDVGIAGLIGAGAGLYLFSFPTHNERWRETGFLAGEAALNSLVTVEALKYSLQRERPYQGNGSGAFFHGGTSFPSEHAAAAWAIAGVFAHEYPGSFPACLPTAPHR